MQKLFDALSNGWRAQRGLEQMTLQRLIDKLKTFPPEKKIEKISCPHSYRGYYSDLSFEREEGIQTVSDMLKILENECLRKTFRGYKGGDFYMDEHTPLWIAEYGSCGLKIMDILEGESLEFITKEDD